MPLVPFARTALTALAAVALLPASALAGTQYRYDALGRLTRVTYDSGVVVQYSYDPAGNHSQVVATGVPVPNLLPVANTDSANVTAAAAGGGSDTASVFEETDVPEATSAEAPQSPEAVDEQ